MSIPYVIILSDSDDEDEPMIDANVPSDPDNESDDSHATLGSSEEDDPSEDEVIMETPPQSPATPSQPSETSPLSSVHATYDTSGPHTIRTPGKSVAGSRWRMGPSSDSTAPITDPYLQDKVWNYLPTTLQEWRKEEKIPSITEVGESSTARRDYPFTHEPPHHTIPLLVTRAIRHEDRLDHIEDAVLEIPGADVLENVQYQIECLDTKIEGVKVESEKMKGQALNSDVRHTNMESMLLQRIARIDSRLAQMDFMMNTLRDLITSMMKGGHHTPKK